MGCKACKGVEKNEEVMIKEIVRLIQADAPGELTFVLKTYFRETSKKRKISVNDLIISLQDYQLSLLSFTVVTGSCKSFRVLTEKFEASVKDMINNFTKYKMNPLNIICEKNHLDLIKVFLPVYLNSRPATVTNVNDTLDFQRFPSFSEAGETFTPIQIACLYGSIGVVDYLVNSNLNKNSGMFNLEKVNEETGENCALLSVRSGSLQAVQLLHRKFSQDFFIRNIFGENALQICSICSSRRGGSGYFEIFMYLIEEVGIDPTVNYEEILIVLQDKSIVEYYEQRLQKDGISAQKQEIDKDNEVSQETCSNFLQVKKLYRAEVNEKCSLGSSISNNSMMTDFFGGSFTGNRPWFTN